MTRCWLAALCGAVVAFTLANASPAVAAFGIERFDTGLQRGATASATPDLRAGGHSDFAVDFQLQTDLSPGYASEDPKDLVFNLPAGLLGDPTSTPTCPQEQFESPSGCGADAQVGTIDVSINSGGGGTTTPSQSNGVAGVFNLERRSSDEVARLGFQIPQAPGFFSIIIKPRTEGDYGLEASVSSITRFYQPTRAHLELWGVPADSIHDPERYADPYLGSTGPVRANPGSPRVGFMSAPTRCDSPLLTAMTGTSYEHADRPVTRLSEIPTLTGCDGLRFDPSLGLASRDSTRADSPAGYDVDVNLPQTNRGDSTTTAHLRRAAVTLPAGVTLNAGVADGLTSCADNLLRLTSRDAAACPNASRIGSAVIDVPILGGSLTGGVYVRPQSVGETYRIAIVASGFGVNVKLPGVARPDPQTGQITAIFSETPQVPFSRVRLSLDGGQRAPLATPTGCEELIANGTFTPWSGTPDVSAAASAGSSSYDGAGAPCPSSLPFGPSLSGGTKSSVSGRTTSLSVRVGRDDRNQELRALSVQLPLGLSAIVRGVPLCSLADAAAGTCGAQSRVGSVRAVAGAGSNPFAVTGSGYLTRGYKGAPYGLSFVIPVVAGPFDLGTVIVQAKVDVDPVTTQLRVESDAFPRIVQGVPLRLRAVDVTVDRPRFALTPTNCKVQAIGAQVFAVQGAVAYPRQRYQASGCARQRYKPKIKLSLEGRGQTKDGSHPALAAAVEQRKGSANLLAAKAVLPRNLALDPGNARALCSFEAGRQVKCPKTSVVGRAKIATPLLNRPLRGPVYFVENQRVNKFGRVVKTLPTLLIALRGEIALNIRAKTSVRDGRNLVTTFSGLPDQPFSRFDLYINGGRSGILAANSDLCKSPLIAEFDSDAQSGKRSDPSVPMSKPCS